MTEPNSAAIEEKLATLAKAILELADKSAHTWEFCGDEMVANGVTLEFETESALKQIIGPESYK